MESNYAFLFEKIISFVENDNKKLLSRDFLKSVINQLFIIYGEDNILTPALTDSIEALKINLTVYDYPKEKVEEFFLRINQMSQLYNQNKKYYKNSIYTEIEKNIIDMMVCKKNKFTVSEKENFLFESSLHSKYSSNLICRIFNLLFNPNQDSVYNYWFVKKDIDFKNEDIVFLTDAEYQLYGLNLAEVKKLSSKEIKQINSEIISEMVTANASEVGGGRNLEKPKRLVLSLTSGNAIIDGILLLAFIATQLFIGLLVLLKVLN